MSAQEHGISIGRIVTYRSRTGDYDVPAIITCTTDSIFEPGVEAGHVPALSSDTHVHLTCFTSGKPGMRREGLGDATLSENVAGCYQEWDRVFDPEGGPGTWRWPTRV